MLQTTVLRASPVTGRRYNRDQALLCSEGFSELRQASVPPCGPKGRVPANAAKQHTVFNRHWQRFPYGSVAPMSTLRE